jgi:NAD(P)-dependent dehydrogenase (short-subunit alcohol dehydrogenase family)
MSADHALAGRVALVAGAGRGIGAAVAARLAAAGATVVALDSREDRAQETVASIRAAGGEATALVVDLLDPAQVGAAVTQTVATHGRIDVLVTVAGGSWAYVPYRPTHEVTDEEWSLVQDLNLGYVFRLSGAALGAMVAAGSGGSVVYVGSIAGVFSSPLASAYGAAKAGLSSLTKSLAQEYGPHGIRVNCVAPGRIETPATASTATPVDFTPSIPLRRLGRPDEVADAVLFLAGDLSRYVSGQTLLVDGGASSTPALVPGERPDLPATGAVGGRS